MKVVVAQALGKTYWELGYLMSPIRERGHGPWLQRLQPPEVMVLRRERVVGARKHRGG